jgi:hypothetical protein
MQLKMFALSLFAILAPSLGFAQGSGSTSPNEGSFRVIHSVRGTIMHIDEEEGLVTVEDRKGNVVTAKMSKGTTLKADKGTAFRELSDEGELALSHLKTGLPVKLTFRSVDWTILELKVLKS